MRRLGGQGLRKVSEIGSCLDLRTSFLLIFVVYLIPVAALSFPSSDDGAESIWSESPDSSPTSIPPNSNSRSTLTMSSNQNFDSFSTVLITGAGGGLGKALAQLMLAKGKVSSGRDLTL